MHLPQTTYRLQFNPFFGFNAAKEIIPYLKDLGVSHVYASPIFKSRKGSTHGYDVVDPAILNPELGSENEFMALISELKKNGLMWLQDIVPNHMAYDTENQMLMDIFENGQDSEYFKLFDIEWEHKYENMHGKVLAPLLGGFFAECLESAQIQLSYSENGLSINYYSLRFPLRVSSYVTFFEHCIDKLKEKFSANNPDFIKFLGTINLFKSLASRAGNTAHSGQIKHAKAMLWALYNENSLMREFIEYNLAYFNGVKGVAESFDALDKLIAEQFYRLSFWKVASEEINYRRFFTVNELISLRVEDDDVLQRTHQLVFDYANKGMFNGLRVDHIDGLFDPASYLAKIREKYSEIYLIVEKIFTPEERLPAYWPVQGTTGYDFLNYVNGIFCCKDNQKRFSSLYEKFCGANVPYEDLLRDKKRLIISKHLAGNIDNLAHKLKQISSNDRYGRDITLYGLRRALVEIMASFPVYRTYVDYANFSDADKYYIETAINTAKEKLSGYIYEFNFIEKFLLLKYNDAVTREQRKMWVDFVMNFQQYTGPLMAKGFEDTFLYVYNRLISLNEVGGSPGRFGFSLEEYHAFVKDSSKRGDCSLNATSTHDTKRGEDARARLNVLSEIPDEWEKHLNAWSKINQKAKSGYGNVFAPDENDEYFLYQTLIGALPFEGLTLEFKERVKAYCIKAVRESKRHTAWIKHDEAYENGCIVFVERILDDSAENDFLKDFFIFQKKIAHYGALNSLSQTLLKITAPGSADFYQGTEEWDFSLVDPDNRRPVDYQKRIAHLKYIKDKEYDLATLIQELILTKEDGRIKLFLIYQALAARKRYNDIFLQGEYLPLEVKGKFRSHVVAFARRQEQRWALIIAPRFFSGIVNEHEFPLGKNMWGDTLLILPQEAFGRWNDAISGQGMQIEGDIFIGNLLSRFCVSLLIKM